MVNNLVIVRILNRGYLHLYGGKYGVVPDTFSATRFWDEQDAKFHVQTAIKKGILSENDFTVTVELQD